MKNKNPNGFTLLEILLVVAAIAILAGIVIFAVNPNKQLGDVRNAQRKVDVNTVLNAMYQYMIDNSVNAPAFVQVGSACNVASQEICKSGGSCTGLTNLDTYLVGATSKYLVSIPFDPSSSTINGSGYEIYRNVTSGRITVCAPNAEQGATITVTR